jgi:uncharacterized protein YukE
MPLRTAHAQPAKEAVRESLDVLKQVYAPNSAAAHARTIRNSYRQVEAAWNALHRLDEALRALDERFCGIRRQHKL